MLIVKLEEVNPPFIKGTSLNYVIANLAVVKLQCDLHQHQK